MRYLIFFLVFVTVVFGQRRPGAQVGSAYKDSYNKVETRNLISDSTIWIYPDDTTSLKAESNEFKTKAYLKERASGTLDGGIFYLVDSTSLTQPDKYTHFTSQTTGKVWKRDLQKTDAAYWGLTPYNSKAGNEASLQNALDNRGDINLLLPGAYTIPADTFTIFSNTSLVTAKGAYFSLASGTQNGVSIINRAASTRPTLLDSNIYIDIELRTNGVATNPFINPTDWGTNLFGIRGHIFLGWCKNFYIKADIPDIASPNWGIGLANCQDGVIDAGRLYGNKDGIHLNGCKNIEIKNNVIGTGDDAIALNALDYATATPYVGNIENIRITGNVDENVGVVTGNFSRMLSGAWQYLEIGDSVKKGDWGTYNGQIYAVMGPANTRAIISTLPTHSSGVDTLDTSIIWVWKQAGTDTVADISGIVYDQNHVEKARHFVNVNSSTTGDLESIHPAVSYFPYCQATIRDTYDRTTGGPHAALYLVQISSPIELIVENCDIRRQLLRIDGVRGTNRITLNNLNFINSPDPSNYTQAADIDQESNDDQDSYIIVNNIHQDRDIEIDKLEGTNTMNVTGEMSIENLSQIDPFEGDKMKANNVPYVFGRDGWKQIAPEEDKIIMHWNGTEDQTMTGTDIRGYNGSTVVVDWGDGNDTTLAITTGAADFNHTFPTGRLYEITISGDLDSLTKLLAASAMTVDIAQFKKTPNLTYLVVGTDLFGDIADASDLTSMATFSSSSARLIGDISNISGWTSMTSFQGSQHLSGNMSNFSGWTSLVTMLSSGSQYTGDLNVISNFSASSTNIRLNLLDTSGVSYTTAVMPAFGTANITIWLHDNGLSAAEVDQILIDIAATATFLSSATLKLDGTNAARTSASDAAKTTLTGLGWTVTVNE